MRSAPMEPGPLFKQLRLEAVAPLADDQYRTLYKVMCRLGYPDFRSYEQGLITLKILSGENVFGVLPTGGGKSFTFQTVARTADGITLVVSPLLALMQDQASKHRDGAAFEFNSALTFAQKKRVKDRIRKGKVRLLYVSPERLKSTDFKNLLASSRQ